MKIVIISRQVNILALHYKVTLDLKSKSTYAKIGNLGVTHFVSSDFVCYVGFVIKDVDKSLCP